MLNNKDIAEDITSILEWAGVKPAALTYEDKLQVLQTVALLRIAEELAIVATVIENK